MSSSLTSSNSSSTTNNTLKNIFKNNNANNVIQNTTPDIKIPNYIVNKNGRVVFVNKDENKSNIGYFKTVLLEANHTPVPKHQDKIIFNFDYLKNDPILINTEMLNTLKYVENKRYSWLLHMVGRINDGSHYYYIKGSIDYHKYEFRGIQPYLYDSFRNIIFNTLTNRFKMVFNYVKLKKHNLESIEEGTDIIEYYKKKEKDGYRIPDWFYIDKLNALYYKYFTHTKLQSKPISEFYAYLKNELKDVPVPPVPPVPPSKTQQAISWLKQKVQRKHTKKSSTKSHTTSFNSSVNKPAHNKNSNKSQTKKKRGIFSWFKKSKSKNKK